MTAWAEVAGKKIISGQCALLAQTKSADAFFIDTARPCLRRQDDAEMRPMPSLII